MDDIVRNFIIAHIVSIIMELYASPHIPRSGVQIIVEKYNYLLQTILIPCMKADVTTIFSKDSTVQEKLNLLESCFQKYSMVFQEVDNDDKRMKILKTKGYIEPKNFSFNEEFEEFEDDKGDSLLEVSTQSGVFVPLRKSLKFFMEIPGVFKAIMDHVQDLECESGFIRNIIQGKLWRDIYVKDHEKCKKENKRESDSILLPLIAYYDDFVAGAVLGAKALQTKFGAIYVSIACLPPHIASKLTSILFSTLIYTKDLGEATNEQVFSTFVKDMTELCNKGIKITIDGIVRNVYFQCVAVIGDNLGLNGIFNFITAFKSDYCCRFCKATLKEMQEMEVEDENKLRTKESYNHDAALNCPQETGIKGISCFNEIKGLHIIENSTLDLMHDVLEGVAEYDINKLLQYYVVDQKLFSLDYLNNKIRKFYRKIGENKPAKIKMDTNKIKIKMSASKIRNFVLFLGLIIGDDVVNHVPEGEDPWNLYTSLRRVFDLIFLTKVSKATVDQLKYYIQLHHDSYKKLFGDLKPKFHFLLHYPRLLERFGPFIVYWCMRYESRHRELKATSYSTSGNKNSLYTIAVKEMLKFCHMINTTEIRQVINFGYNDSDCCSSKVLSSISENIMSEAKFHCDVKIDGEHYKIGDVVLVETNETELIFGEIIKVISSNKRIYFTLKLYAEDYEDPLYCAHKVVSKEKYVTMAFDDLLEFPSCRMYVKNIYDIYILTPFAI